MNFIIKGKLFILHKSTIFDTIHYNHNHFDLTSIWDDDIK